MLPAELFPLNTLTQMVFSCFATWGSVGSLSQRRYRLICLPSLLQIDVVLSQNPPNRDLKYQYENSTPEHLRAGIEGGQTVIKDGIAVWGTGFILS
jgi:hypothetical protein